MTGSDRQEERESRGSKGLKKRSGPGDFRLLLVRLDEREDASSIDLPLDMSGRSKFLPVLL